MFDKNFADCKSGVSGAGRSTIALLSTGRFPKTSGLRVHGHLPD